REFIVETFLFGADDGQLEDGDSLLESGVVDSTGVLELVGFLEEEFGIEVKDEELVPENLDSIDNLAAFIEKKS
ncbi:MAG: acyl carrier protein, partial [Candidatus Latescibacterota bacterium]